MIIETQLRHTALAASAATTELITRILAKYPQAKIRSSTVPLSDEDISLEVILPLPMSGIYVVRDWVYDLIIELQERYDLIIFVSVVPAGGQPELQ